MTAKTKRELLTLDSFPHYVLAREKSLDLHKRLQAAEKRALEIELSGEKTLRPDSIEAEALVLLGKATADDFVSELETVRRELVVLRRAKEIADVELLQLSLNLSHEVCESHAAEHQAIMEALGDHLAQVAALVR
jgi:hypothetical protein